MHRRLFGVSVLAVVFDMLIEEREQPQPPANDADDLEHFNSKRFTPLEVPDEVKKRR